MVNGWPPVLFPENGWWGKKWRGIKHISSGPNRTGLTEHPKSSSLWTDKSLGCVVIKRNRFSFKVLLQWFCPSTPDETFPKTCRIYFTWRFRRKCWGKVTGRPSCLLHLNWTSLIFLLSAEPGSISSRLPLRAKGNIRPESPTCG